MASEFVPDSLYHTSLVVNEHGVETTSVIPKYYVIGTHATVESAKKFALSVLPNLGYEKSDFADYEERPRDVEEWSRGEGVVVYAKAAPGQEFKVIIDTKDNSGKLRASSADGSMVLPSGVDHLNYLVQTTIDYRADRKASNEIQGAYVAREDALKAAKGLLLVEGTKESDYAEFDSRENLDEPKDWAYGDDVLVHAVEETGENYLISLKTPPQVKEHRKQ